MPDDVPTEERRLPSNGIEINVATAGAGDAVLLVHGWPHTWRLWEPIIPALAQRHQVVAMDLRGLGASDAPEGGYDLTTLVADCIGVLDALDIERAAIVGIDLGTAVAWMTAMSRPERITRLAIMEGLLGALPGAEEFFAGGPPWWFAFHAVPDLAETVLAGHVAEYLDFFMRVGTHDGAGISPAARNAFVASYEEPSHFRCGMAHYRALPDNGRLIAEAATDHEIGMPVLALGANTVGGLLQGQLQPITEDLRGTVIPDCGHMIPQRRPGRAAGRTASVPRPMSEHSGGGEHDGRIDMHVHCIPDFYRDALLGGGRSAPDGIDKLPEWDEQSALSLMDESGVSQAILSKLIARSALRRRRPGAGPQPPGQRARRRGQAAQPGPVRVLRVDLPARRRGSGRRGSTRP